VDRTQSDPRAPLLSLGARAGRILQIIFWGIQPNPFARDVQLQCFPKHL